MWQWWQYGFGSVVLIDVVEWRDGDWRGEFLEQRDWRWWVSRLARLAAVVGEIDNFFFPLGDYVVVISCGCDCCWWFLKASLCFFFLCGGSFLWLWLVVVWWFELWVYLDWWWVWCLSGGFGDFCGGLPVVFGSLCVCVCVCVCFSLVVLVVAVYCVCCCCWWWWVCWSEWVGLLRCEWQW